VRRSKKKPRKKAKRAIQTLEFRNPALSAAFEVHLPHGWKSLRRKRTPPARTRTAVSESEY
jgi:hypothetical protein